MSLDEKLQQQRKVVVRRYPSTEALAQVERGNKFIVVQEDFDPSFVPQGYTLIDMKHKGNSFKTLVPQSLLFYMANPGEGKPEGALEEIADFYGETEDFEDEQIEDGNTSVQEANWATLARNSYETYLTNILVKHRKGERDSEGEPVPEFNPEVLARLDLNDPYVAQRARAIAAVALGKNADEVKQYDVGELLKHITIRQKGKAEKLTKKELERVACYCGSHYELRPEFRNDSEYEYDVSGYGGTKTPLKKDIAVFDAKIGALEAEIIEHRKQKHNGEIGRHEPALMRQYVNLAYIMRENPCAKIDIMPPEKILEEQK